MTFRKELIALLSAQPRSASWLAGERGFRGGEVEEDLRHAIRSARAACHTVTVIPARCRSCGFTFDEQKLSKPGKCPSCRGPRLSAPQVLIEPKPSGS